jgi:uncharacterized protein YndB with AHSA1/START domain
VVARSDVSGNDPPFTITRTFNAPRELVFRAWSDPKYVARWWGPRGFTLTFCEIDFRVGGTFHYCMRSPDGKDYWNRGLFRDIVIPERIENTMYFSDSQGNVVEPRRYGMDGFPSEMLDVVTFSDLPAGQTKLTLQRDHADSVATRFMEDRGWSESLDRLTAVLIEAQDSKQ